MTSKGASVTPPGLPAHIHSLDGLRAISVILVIAGHAALYGPSSRGWQLFSLLFLNAEIGVTWFFVISGFLITTLLLRELSGTGQISLKSFYIRRALRILPPLYVFICVVVLLKYAFGLAVPGQRIWTAATFTYNIVKHPPWGSWWLGHTWSLSVEEQFYLCWPFLLFISIKASRARSVAVILILMAPVIRVGLVLRYPQFANQISGLLPSRMDALMLGALAALCGSLPFFDRFVRRMKGGLIAVLAVFVFVGSPLLTYKFGTLYTLSLGLTLESACLTIILLFAVYQPYSGLGKLLNMRALVFVGVISYDLYLWQQLFITPENTSVLGRLGINVLCLGAVAFASYRWIDGPAMRIKRRYLG